MNMQYFNLLNNIKNFILNHIILSSNFVGLNKSIKFSINKIPEIQKFYLIVLRIKLKNITFNYLWHKNSIKIILLSKYWLSFYI